MHAIQHAEGISLMPVKYQGRDAIAIVARYDNGPTTEIVAPLAILIDEQMAGELTTIAGEPAQDCSVNGEPLQHNLRTAPEHRNPAPRPSNN